jgi:hypothetical protein
MRCFPARLTVLSLFCALGAWGMVTVTITTKRISFEKSGTSAVVKGTITGYAITDYLVHAHAGQTMTVTFKSSNGANYFNVLPPGSSNLAVFTGSVGGNRWSGTLNADGDYKLRVYLMRSAARRNETAEYTLRVSVDGDVSQDHGPGKVPVGNARIKETPFHATGKVPCVMGNAPWGSQQCPFGVLRGRPGDAEVHLAPPRGFERVLTFRDGNVTSDKGSKVKAEKHDGMWFIDVNGYEHYQIPDIVILGE